MRRLLPALLMSFALAACMRTPPEDHAAVREAIGDEPVVLLSASWCGYCRKLRADLEVWGVPFAEYDVEDSDAGASAFALLHSAGVPVLLINERRFDGYVPKRIHASLLAAGLLSRQAGP